jgi:hypothetical protein
VDCSTFATEFRNTADTNDRPLEARFGLHFAVDFCNAGSLVFRASFTLQNLPFAEKIYSAESCTIKISDTARMGLFL